MEMPQENLRLQVSKMFRYTDEMKEFLLENSSKFSRKELTKRFNTRFGLNKTEGSVRTYCKKHGFYAPTDGRFKEGNITWSTGLSKEEHRLHFSDRSYQRMTSELDARCSHKFGDIYQMKINGEAIPYVVTSLDYSKPFKKRITPLTRYVWEMHNGELPDGYRLIHLDGNPQNCDIDNLFAVSDSENLRLNNEHWNNKGEITKTGVAIYRLEKTLKGARDE